MRVWLFWVGMSMVSYDMLGHGCAALAHLTGDVGALVWNTYSAYLWPRLPDGLPYHAYWLTFFAVALSCLLVGRPRACSR